MKQTQLLKCRIGQDFNLARAKNVCNPKKMQYNKIFIIFLLLFLIAPLTSAVVEHTFQYNKQFDLKRGCFDNGFFCGSSFECNITLIYPDGNTLITNQVMTNSGNFRNITIRQPQNNQMGFMKALESCNNATTAGGDTFDIAITADGKPYSPFPIQFSVILLGFILLYAGIIDEKLRIFQMFGSMLLIVMGVITLYPGYSFINWTTLTGKALGFVIIGFGFYFILSHAFSREDQQETYSQSSKEEYE